MKTTGGILILAGALGITLLGLTHCGRAQAEQFDIPYYQARPAERRAMLKRCQDDYRLAQTAECMNAEAAGTRRMGRPLPPASAFPYEPWYRPAAPAPQAGKGPLRGA